MKHVVLALLVLLPRIVSAQALTLDDIITIRTLDSAELISYAKERGFELRIVDIDIWRSAHTYISTAIVLSRSIETSQADANSSQRSRQQKITGQCIITIPTWPH